MMQQLWLFIHLSHPAIFDLLYGIAEQPPVAMLLAANLSAFNLG